MGRAVIVLARAPSAAGKTRLTAGLTPERALALRQALVGDSIEVARSSGATLFICYTPADAILEFAAWPDAHFLPQQDGDLGARMAGAFLDVFQSSVSNLQSAILIGSDLPHLPVTYVEDAFTRLDLGADVVLGPAEDGGYYLVGLRQGVLEKRGQTPFSGKRGLTPFFQTLFTGIDWGTSHVLRDTLARAGQAGLQVAQVGAWFDIDTRADLDRFLEITPPWAGLRTRQWCRATPRPG